MKCLKYWLYLLLIPFNGLGQSTPPLSHQLPSEFKLSSPETKELTKVMDIPVNLASGQPNISVPLYTINTGKQTVPITLVYDAGGIRVEQEATAVGLGWHLDVGGAISRTVRDKDDIISGNTYNSLGGPTWSSVPLAHPNNYDDFHLAYQLSIGNQDGVPDMYNFNANGKSGHFVNVGSPAGIVMLPYNNYSITPDFVNDRWTMIDESGSIYKFGGVDDMGVSAVENTQNVTSIISDGVGSATVEHQDHKASWQLTSMETYDHSDLIKFQYQSTYYQTTPAISRSIVFGPRLLPGYEWLYPADESTDFTPTRVMSAIRRRTQQQIRGQILKKILFNGGYVEFTITGERNDLSDASASGVISPRITNMKVYTNDDIPVREVEFLYGYFNEGTGPSTMRLKLMQVRIKNGTAAQELYSFNYNETIPLPAKNSFARDHWGFYNGANSNADLIPTFNMDALLSPSPTMYSQYVDCSYYPGTVSSATDVYNGANRSADPTYTKAGVLTQIIYPTGGKVNFEYENNTIEPDPTDVQYEYTMLHFDVHRAKLDGALEPETTTYGTGVFTIPENSLTMSGVHVLIHGSLTESIPDPHILGTCRLEGVAASVLNFSTNGVMDDCKEITLFPGTYYIAVNIDPHGIEAGTSVINCNVRMVLPNKIVEEITVGGLRIKSISYDDLQGNVTTKNFSYNDPANPSKSSGFTHKRIKLDHYAKYGWGFSDEWPYCSYCWYPFGISPYFYPSVEHEPCAYKRYKMLILQESPEYDLSELTSVYYKYVTVTDGDGSNGKDVYEHNLSTVAYKSWENGPLKHHWVYNASSALVKEEILNYTAFPTVATVYTGFQVTCKGCHPCLADVNSPGVGLGAGNFYNFNWRPYYMHSTCLELTSKETIDYFGANSVTQTENYIYDPISLMRTSITKNISGGDVLKTTYMYPNNIVTSSPIAPSDPLAKAAWLLANHVLDQVLETFTSVNGKVVSGKYVTFKDVTIGTNTFTEPHEVYEIETKQPIAGFAAAHVTTSSAGTDIQIDPHYKLQSSTTQYDEHLNANEIKSEHGNTYAFIHQYNKENLTAKVVNALQSQIAYSSFETRSSTGDNERGNWNYNEDNIVNDEHITGKNAYHLNYSIPDTKIVFGNAAGGYAIAPPIPTWGTLNCIVSYWRKGEVDVRVNNVSGYPGTPTTVGNTVNGWTYCEHIVDASHSVIVSCGAGEAIIDELRLYPIDAQMETCTYDPLVGITTMCNINNTIYYYEYDGLGRLKLVRDQNGNITKKADYALQSPE